MVRLLQKDMRLVLEAADELGASLPGTALAHQLFNAVEASGGADLGTQSLYTVLAKLAGVPVPRAE
jgi:3-hydroxyisobutyrate dehydrogenase-like beta-hydroxyacid dehydrogenase